MQHIIRQEDDVSRLHGFSSGPDPWGDCDAGQLPGGKGRVVSEPRRLNVEIFGFDIAEASQIRRIRTILSLGHNVHSFTMRRGNMNTGFQADWPNTHLFNTAN
ncbi:MAG: hypothetical protein AAF965_07410, partial [Pseudomonadota bacterium]